MSTEPNAAVSFDPDAFMAKRAPVPQTRTASAPAFDPDDFMAKRQAPVNLPGAGPKLLEAVQSGKVQPQPETQFEKERDPANQAGFWGTVWNKVKDAVTPEQGGSAQPFSGPDYSMGSSGNLDLGREVRRQAERPLPSQVASPMYRAATTVSPLVMGLNPEASEKASDVGNWKGVLGEAAVPAAIAAAPLAVEGAAKVAKPITRYAAESAPARAVTGLAKRVAEPYGVGVEGETMLKKGLSPYAKQTGYDAAVERASGDIVKYHEESPIKSVKDLDEAIPEIQKKIMSEEIKPVVAEHASEELAPERMARVQKAVEDSISPFADEFDPAAAKDAKELAEKMGKSRTVGDLLGGNRGGLLGYVNGKLESYFNKYPSARRSDLMKNPDTAAWAAARGALREEVLSHLADQGESGMADARARWGALEELSKTTERRINQADRTKPMSLPRILGMVGAAPTGGLSLIAGEVAHHLNKTDVLVRRGIEKMANAPREAIDVTPRPARPISRIPPPERQLTTGPGGPPPAVPLQHRVEPTGRAEGPSALGTRGKGGAFAPKQLPAPAETRPAAVPFANRVEATGRVSDEGQLARKGGERVPERKLLPAPAGTTPPAVPLNRRLETTGRASDATRLGPRGEGGVRVETGSPTTENLRSAPDGRKLLSGPTGVRAPDKIQGSPQYAYRVRDVGEEGISHEGHAQASTSEEDVRRLAPSRGHGDQEVVRVDLSKLKPDEYQLIDREGSEPWVKFKRALDEHEVEKVGPVTDIDRQAADKAGPELRGEIETLDPHKDSWKIGMPRAKLEKGIEDVRADGIQELSPEAVH